MMNDIEKYCEIMERLYQSGDDESIDIYNKIMGCARENSLLVSYKGNYIELCDEDKDEELAEELGVSIEQLKKAFLLFIKIGLVVFCDDKEILERGGKHGK